MTIRVQETIRGLVHHTEVKVGFDISCSTIEQAQYLLKKFRTILKEELPLPTHMGGQ